MGYLVAVLAIGVYLLQIALMLRLVFDWVQSFARNWRPSGITLVLATGVYAVTDPPMLWLRRRVPPLNVGGMSLDLGFLILVMVVSMVFLFLQGLTYSLSGI